MKPCPFCGDDPVPCVIVSPFRDVMHSWVPGEVRVVAKCSGCRAEGPPANLICGPRDATNSDIDQTINQAKLNWDNRMSTMKDIVNARIELDRLGEEAIKAESAGNERLKYLQSDGHGKTIKCSRLGQGDLLLVYTDGTYSNYSSNEYCIEAVPLTINDSLAQLVLSDEYDACQQKRNAYIAAQRNRLHEVNTVKLRDKLNAKYGVDIDINDLT